MARNYWVAPIGSAFKAAGTALASSTTLTDISPFTNTAGAAKTTNAGFLEAGMEARLKAWGTFSNTSTPTLLLGFYYGGVAGTALAASSAITTTTGATNWPWRLEYEGMVRTDGATGTIVGQGKLYIATSLTAWTIRPIPETALATVTIDTTATKVWTVGAQWGTSNAANTIQCHYMSMDVDF